MFQDESTGDEYEESPDETIPTGPFSGYQEALRLLEVWSNSVGFEIVKFKRKYRKNDGLSAIELRCSCGFSWTSKPHEFKCPWHTQLYRPVNSTRWIIRARSLMHNHTLRHDIEEESEDLEDFDYECEHVHDLSIYDTMPTGPFASFELGYQVVSEWTRLHGFRIIRGRGSSRNRGAAIRCYRYGRTSAKKQSRLSKLVGTNCPWRAEIVRQNDDGQFYLSRQNLNHNHGLPRHCLESARAFYPPALHDRTLAVPNGLDNISYQSFPAGPFPTFEIAIEIVSSWCLKQGFSVIRSNRSLRNEAGRGRVHYLTDLRCKLSRKTGKRKRETSCPWRVQVYRRRDETDWITRCLELRHSHGNEVSGNDPNREHEISSRDDLHNEVPVEIKQYIDRRLHTYTAGILTRVDQLEKKFDDLTAFMAEIVQKVSL